MDIARFQGNLTNLISGKGINVKGSDVEKIKQESGLSSQTGPLADTVEINFARLAEVQGNPSSNGNVDVAALVSDVSQMSLSEAQAALSNPQVFKTLVQAGILE